jgi:hypothetical protein
VARGADEVEKAVSILIAVKGAKEAEQEVEKTYDKAHKGNEEVGRDSRRAGENVDLFMRRWKHQLLAVGTALGVLWGLAKFSPVASSMISMVGTALGYLASIILMPLLPLVIWLTMQILKLADWFSKLPDPIKLAVAALFGLAAVLAALRALGVLDLAKKIVFGDNGILDRLAKFLAGWNAMLAAGGLAGGIAFGAALLTGLLVGLLAVGVLIKSGVIDWVYGIGRAFEQIHPLIADVLKIITADLSKVGAVALRTGSALMALAKGVVSGNWADWANESKNYIEGLKSDFADIDKQRGEALNRMALRAAGQPVTPYVRPELANPTPLNADVGKWLGLDNPTGTGAGTPGTTAAGLPGGVSQGYADQVRSEARAAGVPEAAIDQVLKNMGGIIQENGQQWSATMGTNTTAAGTALQNGSAGWGSSLGANVNAAGTALQTGSAGWAPTVTTATGEVNTAIGAAGGDWGSVIIDAIWSGLRGALKALPGGGILESLLNAGATGIPSHATGGRVAKTGLALMHEGDWIRSSFGDTTRTGQGGSVQNSGGGGGGITLTGPVTIVTQATDARALKADIIRELGGSARRA